MDQKLKQSSFFDSTKHSKTPKINTLLGQNSPSKANDLGSDRIRILILIIRIPVFTIYSDLFWIGSEPDSIPTQNHFFCKRNVQEKFQLKIPNLSKNDCSATWKPNTNQKNFNRDQLRNVQRYQK